MSAGITAPDKESKKMNEKIRRIITTLTCTALAAAMFTGCTAPVNTAEPEVTPDIIATAEPTAALAETAPSQTMPAETQSAETDNAAAALPIGDDPLNMLFASGAGAWGTELTLNADGTFTGEYHDSEMIENSEKYPKGTVYYCKFSGKFANVTKIDDHSYAMTLEELTKDESMGAEWIEDEVRFVLSDAHGMENGTDFVFYMPDTALDGLNSEFLSWWPDYYKLSGEAGEIPTTLGRFALMNGTEHFGFFTYEG